MTTIKVRSWQMTPDIHFLLLATILVLVPTFAFCANGNFNDLGNFLCEAAGAFSSNAGRGIAIISVSILGVLATVGRVTWNQALVVGVGVAVLFGAPTIILDLGASGGCPT